MTTSLVAPSSQFAPLTSNKISSAKKNNSPTELTTITTHGKGSKGVSAPVLSIPFQKNKGSKSKAVRPSTRMKGKGSKGVSAPVVPIPFQKSKGSKSKAVRPSPPLVGKSKKSLCRGPDEIVPYAFSYMSTDCPNEKKLEKGICTNLKEVSKSYPCKTKFDCNVSCSEEGKNKIKEKGKAISSTKFGIHRNCG